MASSFILTQRDKLSGYKQTILVVRLPPPNLCFYSSLSSSSSSFTQRSKGGSKSSYGASQGRRLSI